jgi:hypothetical protein
MPTALKTTTASFTIDEPSIFMIGTTAYETKGGVTITPAVNIRQIEVDGVSQAMDGLDFVESATCTVSTTLVALPDTTLSLLNWNVAATGTLPDQAYAVPDIMRLLASTSYLDNVSVRRRRRGDGIFLGITIPRALITSWVPSAGTSGDGTVAITIESRAPIATPYAKQWSVIRNDDAIALVTV